MLHVESIARDLPGGLRGDLHDGSSGTLPHPFESAVSPIVATVGAAMDACNLSWSEGESA